MGLSPPQFKSTARGFKGTTWRMCCVHLSGLKMKGHSHWPNTECRMRKSHWLHHHVKGIWILGTNVKPSGGKFIGLF